MQPYFTTGNIALYHGDCREVLPSLGVKADMALVDPPYGETSIEWDRWPERWVASVGDCLSETANLWCFGSMRMFLERRNDFAFWRFVQEIVWEKHNGSGFIVDRFRRVHELACHFVRVGSSWDAIYKNPQFTNDAVAKTVRRKNKPAHYGETGEATYTSIDGGPRMMRSVMQCRSMHGKAIHPTQKPVPICERLIDYSCPKGGLLLSPFAGSGSDLVAAKLLGIRAIGCEVNEEYCERAAERLRQGVLFSD